MLETLKHSPLTGHRVRQSTADNWNQATETSFHKLLSLLLPSCDFTHFSPSPFLLLLSHIRLGYCCLLTRQVCGLNMQ